MSDAIFSIFSTLSEMFNYAFLVRAFIVGALVSICAALLGASLVLKRYSMIGDGLSHVGFGALAIATACNAAPLSVSIPIVVAAAFLLLHLGEKRLIKGDAAIALISTSSLAIGVVIISQTTGMNTDVCNYLFGSILAMNKTDVYLSVVLSIVMLVLFVVFYHKLFALTFDETFAKATGLKTGLYNTLIAFLTAIIIVLGMRMMGAMLISALIIFPALTSMRLFKKFKSVSVCSVCVSIFCFFVGVVVSYIYATPTGASIVLLNICAFILFWLINTILTKRIAPVKKLGAAALICAALFSACGNAKEQRASVSPSAKSNAAGTLSVDEPETPFMDLSQTAEEPVSKEPQGAIVDIKEKMFLAQTNDVYLNTEDYLGKTIRLEGLFKREQSEYGNYCFVLRYGPGCCGSDGNAGFEVAWDPRDQTPTEYPDIDNWVEATGVLKTYEEDGYPYLYISLSSLNVLEKRGAEFVTQ
ncbi:MAG: metal ABC transporter permease [Treponema sp.]|jgi:zinc transport system permease protein|nr:metal ABC transporter permease [Treponema sp.]